MLATKPATAIKRPYPGLRSFESSEAILFHGREQHVEELLRRLSSNRFLAVVGGSGSGKSSLVRAGLLPALYRGYLVGATTRWRVAVMRPGSAPLAALAQALQAPDALGKADAAALEESSYGLVNVVRAAGMAAGESLLVVVDQFEELFRFRRESADRDGGAEASLFVSQLLRAADEYGASVYVAITMRSDFLGDCAQFQGLPEALNRGQYLIPRMTREQRSEAITASLDFFDASMSDRLVQRLLNDAGDDPDQLPVMQHALQQTYAVWEAEGRKGEIDLSHYKSAGTMEKALHEHAERVYAETAENGWIAQRIFRCLTVDENGRAVRRPASLGRILRVLGVEADPIYAPEVRRIVKLFGEPRNSFLVWAGELDDDTVVDISHESLIRKWATLQGWVRDEAKGVDVFRYLRRDAALYPGEAGLWADPDLSGALKAKREMGWNEAWAAQYSQGPGASYAKVEEFLDLSVRERQRQHNREKWIRLMKWGVPLLVAVIAIVGVRLWQSEQERRDSEAERKTLTRGIEELQNAKNADSERLKKLQEQITEAESRKDPAAAAELKRLRDEQDATRKNLSDRESLIKQSKEQADKATQDYSQSLKRINELQAQLTQAWTERDSARSERDKLAGNTVQSKPPPDYADAKRVYDLTNQLKQITDERDRLKSELSRAAAPRPVEPPASAATALHLLPITQSSWQVSPADNPLFGILLGDLSRATARIYVIPVSSPQALPADAGSGPLVKAKLAELSTMPCPTLPDPGEPIHCFIVNRQKTNTQSEEVGLVNAGGRVWQLRALNYGTNVLSLAVVRGGPVAAAQKQRQTEPERQVQWNTEGTRLTSLGDLDERWKGTYLFLSGLSTDEVLTLAAFATDDPAILQQMSRSKNRRPIDKLDQGSGTRLSQNSSVSCSIKRTETCWITLPAGQLVGVTARALAYARGKAELTIRGGGQP